MKSIMKKLAVVLLASMMVLTLGACSEKEEEKPEAQTTIDFTAYPASFEEWTMNDVKTVLKEANLITNEDFVLMDLSANEIEAMSAKEGFLYVDANEGSVSDVVISFDPATETGKNMLDCVAENAVIAPDGNLEAGVPVDALIGNYCFCYLTGSDDEHINAFIAVLKEIVSNYGIEGGFINE